MTPLSPLEIDAAALTLVLYVLDNSERLKVIKEAERRVEEFRDPKKPGHNFWYPYYCQVLERLKR